jgi:hypothetical protein
MASGRRARRRATIWRIPDELWVPPHTFVDPTVDGIRLDWCRLWATDCGGAAAAAWCRQVGYSAAVTWEEDSNVSARGIVTKLVGDGRLCQPPNRCDSFASITCR